MQLRVPLTHLILLAIVLAVTGYIAFHGYQASSQMKNLVVLAPVALAVPFLVVASVGSDILSGDGGYGGEEAPSSGRTAMDVVLLVLFAALCFSLTRIGFDVATFVFLWIGIVLSGGKGVWQPPVFSAVMTVFLVKGFGSLFPYPMTSLVL